MSFISCLRHVFYETDPLCWTQDWSVAHKSTRDRLGWKALPSADWPKLFLPFEPLCPPNPQSLESHRRADSEGRSGQWTYDQPQKDRICSACPHIEIEFVNCKYTFVTCNCCTCLYLFVCVCMYNMYIRHSYVLLYILSASTTWLMGYLLNYTKKCLCLLKSVHHQ